MRVRIVYSVYTRLPTFLPNWISDHCVLNPNPNSNPDHSPDHDCSHLLVRNVVGRKGGHLNTIHVYTIQCTLYTVHCSVYTVRILCTKLHCIYG